MSFLEDWNLQFFDRYKVAAAAGQHDSRCEQRERSSLCHCSKRARETAGNTDLPQMVISMPTCGTCGADLDYDGDSFDCPGCSATWPANANDGDKATEFTDDYGDEYTFGGEQYGARLYDLAGGSA